MLPNALPDLTRTPLDAKTFERFRELIYRQSGIALQDNKAALVAARVAKRMRALGLADYGSYLQHVVDDDSGTELVHLLDAISTNVTSFYREPVHFEHLTGLITGWLDEGATRLRLWSAACSTGEEPYTIAITVAQAVGSRPVDWKVLATDISTSVLQQAARGEYAAERLAHVPPDARARYFSASGGTGQRRYQVSRELRERILFRRLNLATPPFPLKGALDAVFCRNVMIYFDPPTRERLVGEIHRLLRPGGHLYVGHAESLTGIRCPLKSVKPSVYRRSDKEAV